jgi:hypothetical protein
MPSITEKPPTAQAARKPASEIGTLRAELALLQARYDSGAVSQAVLSIIRSLETELSWIEHRGRHADAR